MEENKQLILANKLLAALRTKSQWMNGEIYSIYYHLCEIMGEVELQSTLEWVYEEWLKCAPDRDKYEAAMVEYRSALRQWNADQDDKVSKPKKPELEGQWWFTAFHKSMRQTDFYGNQGDYLRVWGENLLNTPELLKEWEEMQTWYGQLFDKFHVEDRKLSEVRTLIHKEDPAKYKRYWQLRDMKNNKEQESISGHLDCIFWQTISMDRKSDLFNVMMEVFQEYQDEQPKKKTRKKAK
jgi:hypothetical protein